MELYYSQNSPYARIARMALRESGLVTGVSELLAANRKLENPVLQFSPVGRVPTLVDGDMIITEARHVVDYIARVSGLDDMRPDSMNNWAAIGQEGQILGFLEGIAFWVREIRRNLDMRSDFLINVERDRSERCLQYFNSEAASHRLPDFPTFRSMALAATLGLMDMHQFQPNWRHAYQAISAWFERQEQRDSMKETAPR